MLKPRGKSSIFITFKKFLAPLIIIAGVIIFFMSYNTYLVDHSLEDLKFSLDQTAKAENIGEGSRTDLVLNDVLIKSVSSSKGGSVNIASLEFTRNIINTAAAKDQLKDAEFLLGKMVKRYEQERGAMLLAFDRMNDDFQKAVKFLTKTLPSGAVRPEIFKYEGKVDLSLLEAAENYESNWQLEKAAGAYEEFVNKYPMYPQLRLIELQLADVYFKSMKYQEAKRLYEMLIRNAPQSGEADTAEVLLTKVEDRVKKQAEREKFRSGMGKFITTAQMQANYNEFNAMDAHLESLNKETDGLLEPITKEAETVSKSAISDVDLAVLDKAKELEKRWLFKDEQVLYEEFIARYPTYKEITSVKLLLGGAYLKSMQYEKAISCYGNIIKDYPDSKEAESAKKLISKIEETVASYIKYQESIDSLKKFATTPKLAQAYYTLGVMDIYLFDLDKAEESFNKAMALTPDMELAKKAIFHIGWIYKCKGRYGEAISAYSNLIEKYKNDPLAADSEYLIADAYYKAQQFENAAVRYEKFSDKFKSSPIVSISLFQSGYTYLYNLHNPLKAAEIFKKLAVDYPKTDIANYVSINLLPDAERSYRDYGFIMLNTGKYKEAKEAFTMALQVNKEDAWAHCGLGTANVLLVFIDEGLQDVKNGVSRIPDEYTHAALAFAYDSKSDYENAIKEYQFSIAKNPNFVVSHYNVGRDYLIVGWYDLATLEFKKSLEMISGFAQAHNNLGYAYWHNGSMGEAEFEFKKAISCSKNIVESYYNLGLIYEAQGKYQMAESHFKEALFLFPKFELAKRHLKYVQDRMKK